jgi:predicted ABC-type transport system involved in lysophospholipase L1 biosynthesis ATPase subunit
LLERINAGGTTVIMVTHTAECAARASREIHLVDGRVVDVDRILPEIGRRERGLPLAV